MSCCGVNVSAELAAIQIKKSQQNHEAEKIKSASLELHDGNFKTSIIVPDMHCAICIGKIERGLSNALNLISVRANLTTKTVNVIWNPNLVQATEITNGLTKIGFEHHLADFENMEKGEGQQHGKRLLLALGVAGFSAMNIMLLSVSVWSGADYETTQLFHLISGLIAIPTVAFSGRPFFSSAFAVLSVKQLNMDVPISLAILLALGMSVYESFMGGTQAYFDAAVSLLFFLLIGRYLDHMMREKARGAAKRLSKLTAKGATLLHENGEEEYIAVTKIKPDMRLRINPGERLPVDGLIIAGSTDIDRSLVTGESLPMHAKVGEQIEAGVLNVTGSIEIKAISSATNSYLSEMQKMIDVAENGRSSYTRIADRMARIYAPAVHLLSLMTFVIWIFMTNGDIHLSLSTAIAVLIITCPCALGLAVPVAHVVAANKLMQEGILMRDGSALERLAEIDSVIFDKTGTLTTGNLEVVYSDSLDSNSSAICRALATASSHPFSRAISNHLKNNDAVKLRKVEEVTGYGVQAVYKEKIVRLGKLSWVDEISMSKANDYDQPQNSNVAFAIQGQSVKVFKLQDSLRDGVLETINALQLDGMHIEILSGDNAHAVNALANAIGIKDVYFEQTPIEKITRLKSIKTMGHKAMMVGDGLNDAPSLAAAHVSMAPVSACDIGRAAADFIFTRPSLNAVFVAHKIARKASRIVHQNFALALAYNCISVPLAMAGYVTPLIAALAMSASSIIVVLNSLRISKGNYKRCLKEPIKNIKRNNFNMEEEGV